MALLPTEDNLTNSSTTNAAQKTNFANLRNFLADLLGTDSGDKPAARAALGADGIFKDSQDVASATTVDISALTQVTPRITGTTPITGWTMGEGQISDILFAAATPLTYNATTNNLIGGASMTAAAGDTARVFFDGTTTKFIGYTRADGTPVVSTSIAVATSAEVKARSNNTKAVSPLGLQDIIISGTAQATTSGVAINFTGISAFAKKISIPISKLSTNGTSEPIVQLGHSGGFITTAYDAVGGLSTSAPFNSAYTTGFGLTSGDQWTAGDTLSGNIELTLIDPATNTWSLSATLANTTRPATHYASGSVSLGSGNTLTQARITTLGGANTANGGTANHHVL